MRHLASYRGLVTDQRGTTLAELAIAISIFLLVLLGSVDFGRFYYHFAATEKALGVAARTASVRPAICAGVPDFNARGTADAGAVSPDYGASCSSGLVDNAGNPVGGTVCAQVTFSCTLADIDPATAGAEVVKTGDEIWRRLGAALPSNATRSNIKITYDFDPALNFLGGPFVPDVSVAVTGLKFKFISPLGPLAAMAGASTKTFNQSPPFPSLRAVAPGEDLAAGTKG